VAERGEDRANDRFVERPMSINKLILDGRLAETMSFNERVWALTARIPRGRVTTYGAIARALGQPCAARAVGQALHRNPYAPQVPCHRVVGADGRLTGFAGGLDHKRRLLAEEGIAVAGDRVDTASRYGFD
jgi:methylated-DNA-[protein]-cysteine S-methyltransferase